MSSSSLSSDKRKEKAQEQKNGAKKDLFSSSSSDDDDDLARELATAAARERKRNPHAEEGRAKMPRAHPLEARKPASAAAGAEDKKKKNLFESSSDDDDEINTNAKNADDTDNDDDVDDEAPRTGDRKQQVSGSIKGRKPTGVTRQSTGDANDEDEEGNGGALRINQQYAAKFEEVKRKQELQRLTEKYSKKHGHMLDSDNDDEDAEEDDEEDDDAVLLTRENELAFAKALLAVRKAAAVVKSVKSLDQLKAIKEKEDYLEQRYFPPAEEQMARNAEVFQTALEDKRRARKGQFTLADEYRRAVHTTAQKNTGDDEVDERRMGESDGLRKVKPQSAEERRLRESFLKSAADSAEGFSVTLKDNDGNNNKKKTTYDDEAAEEDEARHLIEEAFAIDAVAASAGTKKKKRVASSDGDEEEGNEDAHMDGAGDDGEAFIRDFFTKELWRAEADDDDDATGGHYSKLAQLAQEEEDEAFFNDAEAWEREFQEKKYRHEEAEDAEHIQTFARPIGEAAQGLLRKQSATRKDARQRRLERAEAARQQQLEELKRLKHLKRQEIDAQRALIATVAGLASKKKGSAYGGKPNFDDEDADEDAALRKLQSVWSEKDLQAEFDPVEFDKKMAQLFNDEYYDETNVDENEIAYFDAEMDNKDDILDDDELDEDEDEERGGTDADDYAGDSKESRSNTDEDDEGNFHVVSEGGVRARAGHKRRRITEELTAEPDLFKVGSLEEAKKLQAGATSKEGDEDATATSGSTGSRKRKRTSALEAQMFSSDAAPSVTGGNGSSSSSGLADMSAAFPSAMDDPIALLYPSSVLKHLEETSFKKRQEIDALIKESRETGGGGGADGAQITEEEAALAKMKEELKRREEEYYQLHYEGGMEGNKTKAPFRYRQVAPEDFMLSIEDILARDDRQLNMIAPMDCYAAYLDKSQNKRDRYRIEKRLSKGFREIAPDRRSRRYGDLTKTVILDAEMNEEEGIKIAQNLRKQLREEAPGLGGDADSGGNVVGKDGVPPHKRGGAHRHEEGRRPRHDAPGASSPSKFTPRTEWRGRGRGSDGRGGGRGGSFRGGYAGGRNAGRGAGRGSGSGGTSFERGRGRGGAGLHRGRGN